MKTIAVVILNWNGAKLLKQFLPTVVKNSADADIVVVDNASTDGSIAWVETNYPDLRTVRFDRNYGYAGGYNRAANILDEYEYLVLLNSDAAPAQGWINPLLRALSDKGVAAVQPKILSYTNPDKFEYAGAAGGFLDKYGYPYCRGRIFSTLEDDNGQYDRLDEIFWASGAALAVNREAFISVGGLDEDFFAHMEEIDLCWRMKLSGGRILYEPGSVVFHLGGGSLNASSPGKTYLNFRNNLLMLHKNLPEGGAKHRLLFKRRLLDTLAWAKFMVTGRFRHSAAIVRAHRHFSKMKKGYTTFPDRDLLAEQCKVNILSQYYLHGHTTFNSLSN